MTISRNDLIVTLDVGGTKIAGGLWKPGEGFQKRCEQPTGNKSEDGIIETILAMLGRLIGIAELKGHVAAVGIGIPGQVDFQLGTVYSPVNLGFSRPVSVKSIVQDRYNVPVVVDNDTNAGAIGEATFGAGEGFRNFIYLSIGTGIGAGIVVNGNVYRGSNGLAGEVGHMSVLAHGPKCECGGQGCLENLVSGPAIARRTLELLQITENQHSFLRKAQVDPREITTRDVFAAARSGDSVASKILSEVIFYLGTCLANLANILDPDAILLGGGIGQNTDLLVEPLNKVLEKRLGLNKKKRMKVLKGNLGVDSVMYGATALGLELATIQLQSDVVAVKNGGRWKSPVKNKDGLKA